MNIQQRIGAFGKLGELMQAYTNGELLKSNSSLNDKFENAVIRAGSANGWFTADNIKHAIMSLGKMLENAKLSIWLERYKSGFKTRRNIKTVGVIMAGNIPAVGFHDLLCVLISGNNILVKSSSVDNILIRFFTDLLIEIEPEFENFIRYSEDKLKDFDAVIATGSNNSSRYFEYYFGKYPHIIRKNMNAVALLTGEESSADLEGLGEDVFRYFGLGCRNVSAILVSNEYDLENITAGFQSWEHIGDNNKYHNNYVYYKTLSLLNNDKFFDGEFYIMKVSGSIPSPLSLLNIITYNKMEEAKGFIDDHLQHIQCVATNESAIPKAVKFGQTQYPELWDYADDVDTMEFLLSL